MTKAEAIAMLKRIQEPEAWEPQINQVAFEALDMAIEALSQKSSEDVISRQAAIDAIHNLYAIHGSEGSWIDQKDAFKALNSLPSAQPERIKGHWVEIASSNHTYKCSVCGRLLVNITDGKNNVAKNYPYCHCGADMRGEQDG